VLHQSRFNFMREARIWYSRDPNQEMLPGSLEHEIVLVDEFFREVTTHSIPTDLGAAQSPVVPHRQPWICLWGCLAANSRQKVQKECPSLETSVSPAS
jgi:hypothetical protein